MSPAHRRVTMFGLRTTISGGVRGTAVAGPWYSCGLEVKHGNPQLNYLTPPGCGNLVVSIAIFQYSNFECD